MWVPAQVCDHRYRGGKPVSDRLSPYFGPPSVGTDGRTCDGLNWKYFWNEPSLLLSGRLFSERIDTSTMSYGAGQKVQKVMVQPINLIFRFLQVSHSVLDSVHQKN